MDIKKTPAADLEKERITFFMIGLAVSLSSFYVLLEWQNSETENIEWTNIMPVFIEKEFERENHAELFVPAVIQEIYQPKISKPEIVYEDYVVVEEIPESEKSENTGYISFNQESNEIPTTNTVVETSAPVEIEIKKEPVTLAETMPQFPGGQSELIRFIYKNIEYPLAALKQGIEGRVWCSFIVEADGSISNINLEEGVFIFLDDEAIRVLKIMPNWIPGQTKGENVRVKVYIPIVFKR